MRRFNGVAQVGRDWKAIGLPFNHPAPWILAGAVGAVNWLDTALRDVGGFLTGLLTGEPAGVQPMDLPTTPAEAQEVIRATRRVVGRVPDFLRIIAELKEGTHHEGEEAHFR